MEYLNISLQRINWVDPCYLLNTDVIEENYQRSQSSNPKLLMTYKLNVTIFFYILSIARVTEHKGGIYKENEVILCNIYMVFLSF